MAPTPQQYDFIVIGGGSGGSGAARRASGCRFRPLRSIRAGNLKGLTNLGYGAKTLLVENGKSGGTCVNVGCVPKKMTWNHASISEALKDGVHYGYNIPQNVSFDFATWKRARDARIKQLNGAYERNWNKENIELIHGTASFKSAKEIEVEALDGTKASYTASKILIATGGHPTLPKGIPGAEYGITSDGFFDIEELPKRMAFVGAGYIAVELAGVMAAIGVEVHMFIRGETFLRSFDPMVQDVLTKRYEDTGIKIHKKSKNFKEVIQLKDGKGSEKLLKIVCGNGEELEVNELLWAIGRAPEIEKLDPVKVGVKLSEKGHIAVDEYQNTNVKGIYAIGDVTGQAELTPVAIAAGRKLSNRLFGVNHSAGGPHLAHDKLDYNNVGASFALSPIFLPQILTNFLCYRSQQLSSLTLKLAPLGSPNLPLKKSTALQISKSTRPPSKRCSTTFTLKKKRIRTPHDTSSSVRDRTRRL